MEINYNLIIKYLVTKKNTFVSKKHILVCSDLFPNKFKDLFQNKYYRYGINQTNGFYNALLTLLNKEFITYNNDEEIYEFKQLTKSIHEININIIDEKHINYLANLLQINFIIFDFKTEEIKIIHCKTECNPYKPTILIANYENFYEPIIYEIDTKKIFSYNDSIIKKIYQLIDNKVNEDLNKLLSEFISQNKLTSNKLESCVNEDIDCESSEEQSPFIKQKTIISIDENNKIIKKVNNVFSETELNKFKKEKLAEILCEKNINININKMLKKDIIKLILE